MKKQVSALNTFWVVKFLNQYHSAVSIEEILEDVHRDCPFLVENLKTGFMEPVAKVHLLDTAYWFSNEFMIRLYECVQKRVLDPNLGYKIGKTSYRAQHIIKTAIGIPLMGPYTLLKIMSKENRKYNRTKENVIRKLTKGHVVIEVIHKKNVIINDFALAWHIGIFESYARIAGASNVVVKGRNLEEGPKKYGDPGRARWEFDIRFTHHNFFARIFNLIISRVPIVKNTIENANAIQEEFTEQILNRDKIIREKTQRLNRIQTRIFKAERHAIEQQLKNISKELVSTEERERRLIAEDLHDSISQSLALSLSKLKNFNQSSGEKSRDLEIVESALEQVVSDIRSLTFQINPPILYDLGLKAAIEWIVADLGKRNNTQIQLNDNISGPILLEEPLKTVMYRAIREIVINVIKHATANQVQVTLSTFENSYVVSIEDDGIGFDLAQFGGKNKKGFGLFSINERLKAFGGEMEIDTAPGKGVHVMLIAPMKGSK
ncbi:MAG: sensor histidine kinase [Desulfobacter sp.]|nr:MAG: sensor histidine kinase [Desulfobacter sp.]